MLPRNIRRTASGKYEISKYLNGKSYSFGSYSNLDEAVTWRNYFESNDWPLNERFLHSSPKFIVEYKGKFKVEKAFGNQPKGERKRYSYGTFDTLEEAIKHRDKCIKSNWDESLRPHNPRKYVHKRKGKYWIMKNDECYGIFTNLKEALYERDLLVKCNWDWDALESIDETVNGEICWIKIRRLLR